jgi:hypothetical protein
MHIKMRRVLPRLVHVYIVIAMHNGASRLGELPGAGSAVHPTAVGPPIRPHRPSHRAHQSLPFLGGQGEGVATVRTCARSKDLTPLAVGPELGVL